MSCTANSVKLNTHACIYGAQALSTPKKGAIIVAIAAATLALLIPAILGYAHIIHGLSVTAQQGMLTGGSIIGLVSIVALIVYHVRKERPNPFPNGQVVNVDTASHSDLLKLNAYSDQLEMQCALAVKNGTAAIFLNHLLQNIKSHLVVLDGGGMGERVCLLPFLKECAFNRFISTRREDLENRMLKHASCQFSAATTEKFRYLSLSPRGLLQDFIFVGKLLQAGYKKIDVVLVGNKYDYQETGQFKFLEAVAYEQGVELRVEWEFLGSVKPESYHLVSAIGCDFLRADFSAALALQHLVKSQGRYYVSFEGYDLVFDEKQLLEHRGPELNPPQKALISSLQSSFQKHQHLHIALVISDYEPAFQWINCIEALTQHADLKKVVVTVMSSDAAVKNLWRFFKLMRPNIQLAVRACTTFDDFKKSSLKQDIILGWGAFGHQGDIEPKIKWLREHHPNATHYYLAAEFNGDNPLWSGFWSWSKGQGTHFFVPESQQKITELMT